MVFSFRKVKRPTSTFCCDSKAEPAIIPTNASIAEALGTRRFVCHVKRRSIDTPGGSTRDAAVFVSGQSSQSISHIPW
jgi:hypothetical protein